MRPLTILALGAGLLLGTGCDDISGPTRSSLITELPRDLSISERAVIDGSNGFALGLLAELRALAPDSPNTFISPLSASMALGMTMNGADGQTWTQMRDVLGFAGLEETAINDAYRSLIDLLLGLDGEVEIGLGNAIWVDEVDLLAGFVDRTETYFDAEVDRLDFDDPSSADVMNGWVDSVTNGRIPKLLDRVDPDALLYLINAIYFNAGWRHTFDADRTAESSFRRLDGTTVPVQMMAGRIGYRTLNAGSPGAVQGVELPYAGGAFTAVVLLPPHGTPIDEWVAGLDGGTWTEWMDHFDSQFTGEDPDGEGLLVRLPRFELEWGDSLDSALRALGMTDAFAPFQADFTRITSDRDDLYVYDVKQKTYVRVDEQGTEAAAATSVSVGPTSAPPSIVFDRPFVFAIRERLSGALLFIGVIGDPSA